jgi:hypothetical protein
MSAITIRFPIGKTGRSSKVALPEPVAAWLRDELIAQLGHPKPRRTPRIRRGRWQSPRRSHDAP